MDVEILSVRIKEGIVYMDCIDVSEENLRRLERLRDDATEEDVTFIFDTHNIKEFNYLRTWLLGQKASRGARTWGEALQSVVGTITMISRKYKEMSW